MQKYCNIIKNKLNMLIQNMEKNVSDFVIDPKRDFVRKSELLFSKTKKFILGMVSQTLGKELIGRSHFTYLILYTPRSSGPQAYADGYSAVSPILSEYCFAPIFRGFEQICRVMPLQKNLSNCRKIIAENN